MIPAVLAAQLAKPLVKWGLIVGGIAILLLSVWLHGRAAGKKVVQQAWDAAIAQQAIDAAAQMLAETKMSNQVLQSHAEEVREAKDTAAGLEREVIRYVQGPAQPCVVDAEFERLFDALSRMPESTENGVPAPDSGPGESVESSEAGATTAEVLQAYYRAVEELTFLWIDYDALVQWERGRYIVQSAQQ